MAIENLTGNETLEELQALLEAFQKRLAILEEKKSFTRPEIYTKVRAEYDGKIQEVHNLMLQKGADLEEALNQAIVDQDTLNIRKQELKDILDEMDLRLAIGEIDEETKSRESQEHIEEMQEIDGKLAALEQKIANFQKMMAAQQPKAQLRPIPAVASAPERPAMPTVQRPAPLQTKQTLLRPDPSAPQTVMPTPEAVRPVPSTRPISPQAIPIEPRHAPEPAPKMAAQRPQQTPPATTAAIPKTAQPTAPATPVAQPVSAAPEPVPNEIDELEKQFASLLGESLATPGPKPSESIEIISSATTEEPSEESHEGELKCPKCGSFNRADNWYCEKCGNELISAQDLLGK